MIINGTTACYPGYRLVEALAKLQTCRETDGPNRMQVHTNHVQLCPQSPTTLRDSVIDQLLEQSNGYGLRLHANMRVEGFGQPKWDASADLSDSEQLGYFTALGRLSQRLNAPVYSVHAGRRKNATLDQMLDNVRRLQSLFRCPVAVEGMYPSSDNSWLMSTVSEYVKVMASGVYFAIDLSHLNIVRCNEIGAMNRPAEFFDAWVLELLMHRNCIEVHISANNGRRDSHLPITDEPWWWERLEHAVGLRRVVGHPPFTIFTESNLLSLDRNACR